jgi:tRNA1(Val) A37 N6-methylase TrmN6
MSLSRSVDVQFHETPFEVASLLARHIPRAVKTILDPAVGQAALLLPLVSRLSRETSVVCVDTDPTAIAVTKKNLSGLVENLDCVHGDFLQAVTSSPKLNSRVFDCVIMNPPYAAKKAEWTECDLSSLGCEKRMYLPQELAFAFRAVECLRQGGRLLAVMPGSMVSSGTLARFRECLGTVGKFHYVHELPKFTFPRVEGRIYLIVFEKGQKGSRIELRNHDLLKPHCMQVNWSDLGRDCRLDFGYHHSQRWLNALVLAQPDLGWAPIRELVDIERGPRKSPHGPRVALHTTDCKAGTWRVHPRHRQAAKTSRIARNDLFIARVGRSCFDTLGPLANFRAISWSDCLFRLRGKTEAHTTALLLSMRLVIGMPAVRQMLERGVGATYITEKELGDVRIPTQLSKVYPKWCAEYAKATQQINVPQMRKLEALLRDDVILPVGPLE